MVTRSYLLEAQAYLRREVVQNCLNRTAADSRGARQSSSCKIGTIGTTLGKRETRISLATGTSFAGFCVPILHQSVLAIAMLELHI